MSLFGKILAVLNIIGAIALFYFAAVNYGKRQSWAYSVLRHDLVLGGLPLDDREKDFQGQPIVGMLGAESLNSIFAGVTGPQVKTQIEEVDRVKAAIDGRISSQQDVRAKTYLLARALLPLSATYLEREELIACRTYLASDATFKVLQARYERALKEGLAGMSPQRTFEEAFLYSLRTQGGEPNDAFSTLLLAQFPPKVDNNLKLADFMTKALDVQRQHLQARLDKRFAQAKKSADVQEGMPPNAQRLSIARLLFALCTFQADDPSASDPSLKGADPSTTDYASKLIKTKAWEDNVRRVYVISGLRMTLAAIGDEAAQLRKLAEGVTASQREEQLTFVLDNAIQIEELRERAELVRTELARIADNERKLTEQEALVKKTRIKVAEVEKELKEARAQTAEALTELRNLSERVRDKRVELRDAISKAEAAERKIVELEATLRAREKAADTAP
jgi:hypothetical protein